MIARTLKSNKSNRNAPLLELRPIQPFARPEIFLGALLASLIGLERAGVVERVGPSVFRPAFDGLGPLFIETQRCTLPWLQRLLGALLRRLLRNLLPRLLLGAHRQPLFTTLLLKFIDAQRPFAGDLRLPQKQQISLSLGTLQIPGEIQHRALDHQALALESSKFGGLL